MSFLRGVFGVEKRAVGGPGWNPGMVWADYPTSWARADTDEAMRLSAVFACLRLLSEAVATLPLDVFRRDGARRVPYPTPTVLQFPDPSLSQIDYLSQVMLSLLTDGNAYCAIGRDRNGVPASLVPLDPAAVTVQRSESTPGALEYRIGKDLFGPLDILHIRGMMLPGKIVGLSPIAYAMETISVGLQAQRFGASFFENGAMPSAVIEAPADMKPEAIARWKATWNANHGGKDNAGKVGLLTNGATFRQVSIQPAQAQFLETRQFQVPDIARIFGVPPHLIADASNSTSWGSGLAEQNLAFGQFSLRTWITRIEAAHTALIRPLGAFMKLNLDALLRASLRDRYDAYAIGIGSRFLTPNEARAREDEPPLPGGDAFPPDTKPATREATP